MQVQRKIIHRGEMGGPSGAEEMCLLQKVQLNGAKKEQQDVQERPLKSASWRYIPVIMPWADTIIFGADTPELTTEYPSATSSVLSVPTEFVSYIHLGLAQNAILR